MRKCDLGAASQVSPFTGHIPNTSDLIPTFFPSRFLARIATRPPLGSACRTEEDLNFLSAGSQPGDWLESRVMQMAVTHFIILESDDEVH